MADETWPRRGRHRATKRRRRVIVAAGVFAAVLVSAKPAYHWIKARRADALSAEAERLVQQEKLGEAAVDYRAALKLDPFGYRSLRGAARLATKLRRAEAVPLWEQVAASPRATASDREEYAGALVHAGMFPAAQKVIDDLLRADPSTRALRLASDYSELTGNGDRAVEYARLAAKRAPGDDGAQARLAQVLAASAKLAERKEARDILWKLVTESATAKTAAVQALARAPELTTPELSRLLEIVRSRSPFGVSDALLAGDLDRRLHPENAAAIYNDIAARWTHDVAARVGVAQWLNGHGQAERVLEFAPADSQDKELLLARLDALATLKRWSEIDEALARPDVGFDPTIIESFRARAAQEQQATLDAEVHWSKAIAAAGTDAQKLQFVANFAEQSGATEAALRAFDQLARAPEYTLNALAGQQRLAAKTRDVNAARNLAEKALALQSSDPDAQNRLLYYNLLLERDVDENAAKAKALAAKFPNRLEFRVTAALGCLRQHNAAGALGQFSGPPIDWEKTPPAWRAVYAASLMANEQAERAEEIIKSISVERLASEEAALVKSTSR